MENLLNHKIYAMRNAVNELLDNTTNTLSLSRKSGVNQANIHRLISGQKTIDNLSVSSLEKLYKVAVIEQLEKRVEKCTCQFNELMNLDYIEALDERFTDISHKQSGWFFDYMVLVTIYHTDGHNQKALVTCSVDEVKAKRDVDFATFEMAFYDALSNYNEDEMNYIFLDDEDLLLYMEISNARTLEDFYKGLKMSYVIDFTIGDKEVTLTTEEGDLYFKYTIDKYHLNDVDNLMLLIDDKNLKSRFSGTEVENSDVFYNDYSMNDVRSELEMYQRQFNEL